MTPWWHPTLSQLTEAQQAVRDQFQEGGSIIPVLLVVLCLAGVVFATVYLTRRQQRSNRDIRLADPARLFGDLLVKLDMTQSQRHLLTKIVKHFGLRQPAVILLSPALFDRYLREWWSREESPADGTADAFSPDLLRETRNKLFPSA